MLPFDDKIRQIVKMYSYPMWIILRNQDVLCTCLDPTTHQPDPNCMKCLGTGRQITIKRIKAARQPFKIAETGTGIARNEYIYNSNYYTLGDIHAHERDIFVDNGHADVIQDPQENRSDHTDPVYYHYIAAPKKDNLAIFLDHFNQVIEAAHKNKAGDP